MWYQQDGLHGGLLFSGRLMGKLTKKIIKTKKVGIKQSSHW
jgi:hypothetical protein